MKSASFRDVFMGRGSLPSHFRTHLLEFLVGQFRGDRSVGVALVVVSIAFGWHCDIDSDKKMNEFV
jgi:hypothetical protein